MRKARMVTTGKSAWGMRCWNKMCGSRQALGMQKGYEILLCDIKQGDACDAGDKCDAAKTDGQDRQNKGSPVARARYGKPAAG